MVLLFTGTSAFHHDSASAIGVLRSSAEAWERLPTLESGKARLLPTWARILAGELPRTTAALLELDFAQRTQGPLAPRLRAAMRWVAARANRCAYAQVTAQLDAVDAGLDAPALIGLAQPGYPEWSHEEQSALEFAHKMTVDSHSVTDGEFAALVECFGERQAAAMVLLLAYASFQDRLLLCLEAPIEVDGPLSPLDVRFRRDAFALATTPPPRGAVEAVVRPVGERDLVPQDPDWTSVTYEMLQSRLEEQRRRPTRLHVPAWDEAAGSLPDGLFRRRSASVWNRIVFGYAPELAAPFEVFLRTAAAETAPHWDPIFGSSLFWVTSRAVQCAYGMGHCEMHWEAAGLSRPEIAERSRLLAGDDWSAFPAGQQRALAFARKLSQRPWAVSPVDIGTLQRDFGPDRALAVALNASRDHYMTRIANGFQLTLERENACCDDDVAERPPAAPSPVQHLRRCAD